MRGGHMTEWIKCSERLPEESGRYLVCDVPYKIMSVVAYSARWKRFNCEEQLWWEDRCKELEAQMPKEGEWISNYDGFEYDVRCSVCGEEALIKEGGSHDHAYSRFCPNCGARMRGEHDG